MSFKNLLNNRVDVVYDTIAEDAYGGNTATQVYRFRRIKARVEPMSGREIALYKRDEVVATHKVFCDAKYKAMKEKDRILFGSRKFNVLLVREIDLMGHHLEIEVQELKE